jgi:hypothetical protein
LLFLNKYEIVKYYLIILSLLITISSEIMAQYYDTGQDPASIKWMQIKTKRFNVIYPSTYGSEGIRFAKSLDDSYSKLSSLYPEKKVKIPVIIHNYTTFSNGYVAWAPRRMEIYPTPEQNGIPLGTMEQLTTHEMTHVLQMSSLKKGFTKALSFLGGEQVIGGMAALLPMWFMEGDAVFAESILSPSGRGRTPAFQKQLKAIVLENPKMYSYDKMIAGSFKQNVPDNYQYGYQIVAWSYAKYGPELWNKTLDYTAKFPFTILPVNWGLYKYSNHMKETLFTETFDSLKTIWTQEDFRTRPVNYEALNPPKKEKYVNYYSPVIIGKDSVIAIKTSFSSTSEFVLINTADKSEKRIYITGNLYPYVLSGTKGKIVWVENQPDPRWENRTYSVIKIMDLKRQTTRQLSFKSRYVAAGVSSDGTMIAAAENTISNENSIVIIDAYNGEILSKIQVPGNAYPQRPRWSDNGTEISIIFLTEEGEGIMSYSLERKDWETNISPGRDDLQSAFIRNDSLFFVSSASGTDNIYLLTSDSKITKLSNSRYGAYDPVAQAGKIIFSGYSISGYNICESNLKDATTFSLIKKAKDPSFLINRIDTIKLKETDASITGYSPVPYRKLGHMFRFHSWMPFYADIDLIQADPTSIRPGFTLMSQNQLSTLTSTFGYEYTKQKTHMFHSGITWKGWVPVIESYIDWGGSAEIAKLGYSVNDPVTVNAGFTFTNTISLPLSFSSGRFSQYFRPSLSAAYANNYIYLSESSTYDYGQTFITGRLLFYNSSRSAIRDIYPRWAQVFDINHTSAPFDKDIYGDITTLKTAIYLPGLVRNHGIRLRYEYELQNPQELLYYNKASLPQGYNNFVSEKINFLSAEYVMPIAYPDLNLPGMIFIKRIRTSLFYDYAVGTKNQYFNPIEFHNNSETFKSFGTQLWADFYMLRIPFMVSSGAQFIWKSFNQAPTIEFLLNIDIFGTRIGKSRL